MDQNFSGHKSEMDKLVLPQCVAHVFTGCRAFCGGQGQGDQAGTGGVHALCSVLSETFYSSTFSLGNLCELPQPYNELC